MNFEKIPQQRDIVSKIFRNTRDFEKKVAQTLEWSQKGGPEKGSRSFVNAVAGDIKLSAEEFGELKKEIKKEMDRLEEAGNEKIGAETKERAFSKEETEMMIESSRKQMLREAKRSGEDPDIEELYADKENEES